MKKAEWIYTCAMMVGVGISVYYLPWYIPLIWACSATLFCKPRIRVILLLSVLAGAGWYAFSAYQADGMNHHLLSSRMSALFGDIGISGLILLTAFIGFLLTLVGSMLGNSLNSFRKEL